jgi:hypothetical protein
VAPLLECLSMDERMGAPGTPARQASAGTAVRFIVGLVIGIIAMGLAIACQGSVSTGDGPLLLGICLAAAGFLGAFVRGIAAFVGVWLGVAAPWIGLALASGQCNAASSPPMMCGSVLAGAALVLGPVPEGLGFLLGRLVRWSLGGRK